MNKKIILLGDEKAFPRQVRALLAEKAYIVESYSRDEMDARRIDWSNCNLLIAEHSAEFDPFSACDIATGSNRRLKVIFVTANSPISVIEERLNRLYPDNIMTSTTILETDELIQTIEKMFAGNLFGLQHYFSPDAGINTLSIANSKQKDAYIKTVVDFALAHKLRSRILECIADVLDEMIMNVIYDAPTDRQGNYLYADRSRSQQVILNDDQAATLSYAIDKKLFGISMSDPFGSLTKDRVLYYLHKCYGRGDDQIDSKKGGAGLGIFKIFENVNQFIINISPGRQTEFMVFISTDARNFRQKSQSFNLFVKG